MCNLYSMTSNAEAIRQLARAMGDMLGHLPPLAGIFPDFVAPIVRNSGMGRAAVLARWGLPSLKWADNGKPERGYPSDPHNRGGARGLAQRALVRGEGPAATVARPRADHRL